MAVWQSKAAGRQRRKRIIVALSACLLAALLFAVGVWQGWFWFAPRQQVLSVGQPGAANDSNRTWSLGQPEGERIEARMQQLLGNGQLLLAWYRLPHRTGRPPGDRADAALAMDQLRYGQHLLEQGNRKAFLNWWTAFSSAWLNADGLVVGSLDIQGQAEGESPFFASEDWLRANLLAARILAQSCTLWPDKDRLSYLNALAAAVLPQLAGGSLAEKTAVVPTAAPILDPGATPTPKPAATPAPEPDGGITLSVLRLASIDLFAMQALAQLDPAWEPVQALYLQRVLDGYLSDALPLYAWAWQPDSGGYVPFSGAVPVLDTEEALQTVLHLCEAGHIPQGSINWIRDQLYNQSALYRTYHIGQGTAADQRESLPAYAMAARIARIINDENLYQAATSRLLWHQATSRTSPALSAFFREDETGAVYVWAVDNTWALLALR